MARFRGYCEKLKSGVGVSGLANWIARIPFEEWPQDQPLNGKMQPAMIVDPNWHGFGVRTTRFIDDHFGLLFNGCAWRRPMISAVMPGLYRTSHADLQPPEWQFRVHVPLVTNPSAFFFMDRPYYMEVGNAYKVNTEQLHAVINHGSTPRIHFMFDVFSKEEEKYAT
jgi:hypothetical protein